jgi:hypothetical protein
MLSNEFSLRRLASRARYQEIGVRHKATPGHYYCAFRAHFRACELRPTGCTPPTLWALLRELPEDRRVSLRSEMLEMRLCKSTAESGDEW